MSQRVTTRSEQLYVSAWLTVPQKWALGGDFYELFPWGRLGKAAHVYVHDVAMLRELLRDAVQQGYQILEGFHSERRGLRGFTVALGAHGWIGKIHARSLDSWALDEQIPERDEDLLSRISVLQKDLRKACTALNQEPTPFRPSGFRWLGSLYDRLGTSQEPDGCAEPLPKAIAMMARAAHVAGPIIHARTTLAPFTTLDRTRAYGNAMCQPLPIGPPARVPLGKTASSSLTRWTTWDLMRQVGLAEATVEITAGSLLPLMPLMRGHSRFDRATTLYPTGTFRGTFCLHELAEVEQTGIGRVTHLHSVVTFQAAPVLAPVIGYLREIETALPPSFRIKRLEHMLYGRCARSLAMSCLGSGPSFRPIVGRDLLSDRTARRVEGSAEIRELPIHGLNGEDGQIRHPVFRAKGKLVPEAEWGTMDRPDRSAWITATNRIEISRLVQLVDERLGSKRPGESIGRVYVDGLEVEATPEQLGDLGEGNETRRHGTRLDIFRAGASVARLHDGTVEYEAAGLYRRGAYQGTPDQFIAELRMVADASGGPFAGGRVWPPRGEGDDPRFYPNVVSEPPHLSAESAGAMGFCPQSAADA